MSEEELRAMVAGEQHELADVLRGLTPEQWTMPSLCAKWTVHDAAVHIAIHCHVKDLERSWRLLRVGYDDLKMQRTERAWPKEQLIDYLESPATLTTPRHMRTQLSELIIHQQDIRRPLGATRVVAPERLAVVLDYITTRAGSLALAGGAFRRGRGMRLVATDLPWSSGEGPEVSGTGEALLMAMNGRRDALRDLDGPGAATLAARLK